MSEENGSQKVVRFVIRGEVALSPSRELPAALDAIKALAEGARSLGATQVEVKIPRLTKVTL